VASTIDERPAGTERDPVTLRERWRAAAMTLAALAVIGVVVAIVQAVRGESTPTAVVPMVIGLVVVLAFSFAFPRYRRFGGGRRFDWSKESVGSKVAAVVAVLLVTAIVVARTIWRLDD
jgi:FtsH-binding integral membrane protein